MVTMSLFKPTIILVPGSFALRQVYTPFEEHIRFYNHEIVYAYLPSIGRRGNGLPPATIQDDAAHIRSLVLAEFERGRSVVIVAHSYGGLPATESLKGLTVKERGTRLPAVLLVIYATAIVLPVGKSVNSMRGERQGEMGEDEDAKEKPGSGGVELSSDGYLKLTDLVSNGARDFSLLPAAEQVEWAKYVDVHSAASFDSPLTHAGYRDVPVTYLLASKDQSLTPDIQEGFVQTIRDAGADVTVVPIESDHCWSASVPKSTAVKVLQAIETVVRGH